MKGIILAGGSGTRLYPATKAVSKQLLAIYDKPMINYPLSVLMLSGIKDILIITTPFDLKNFKLLFSDGSDLGLNIEYCVQKEPRGIGEAFILGEEFIGEDDVCLILGDNIFYGNGLTELLVSSINDVKKNKKAIVFGYYVNDPEKYGVVEFSESGEVISIVEKPKFPKSSYAVVGLYFYPNSVVKKAKQIKPSSRGELEITSINKLYQKENNLIVKKLNRGFTWLDAGTHESMLEASNFIYTIEKTQGLKIACLEEIAFDKKFIDKKQLVKLCKMYNNSFSEYLKSKLC